MELPTITEILGKSINIEPVYVIIQASRQLDKELNERFERSYHLSKFDKTGETLGCGCTYCMTLHAYTAVVKEKHRLNKRVTNDDYIFLTNDEEQYSKERIKLLDERRVILKQHKDFLKENLNL